jgi:hypothetical protein
MSKNNFEDIIKKKLSDSIIEPPKEVWFNIEKELDKSRRYRRILYTTFSGIAAAIIFAISFNFFFIPKNIIINNTPIYSYIPTIKKSSQTIKPKLVIIKKFHKEKKGIHIVQNSKISNRETITNSLIASNCFENTLDIEFKTNNRIIINDDRAIINNNLKTNKKKNLHIGLKIASRSSSTIKQDHSINSLASFRTNPIGTYNSPKNSKIPTSELSLNTNINLTVDYQINNRLSLSSGIGYLSFSNKKENGIYYGELSNLYNNKNFQDKYKESDINKINQNFTYLEIPLQLKFSLIKKKVSLYISAGLGIDFLIKNQSEIIFKNEKSVYTKAKNISKTPICSIASIGLNTCLYKYIYINAEVQYRYYNNKISTNKTISINQGMPNISLGLSYKI